jgi:hypothetical protein
MSIKYLIRLWILTILIAPFVYGGYELYSEVPGQVASILEVFPVIILFSIFFSLPTLILTFFMIKSNKHFGSKSLTLKLVIWSVLIIGIIVTLQLIGGSLIPTLTISYTAAVSISVLILELRNKLYTTKPRR